VTSAPDRAGKTETIVNLAVWLARSRRRVIVVDCDLRQPRVHELFGLANDVGVTSVARGERLGDALQTVRGIDHLYAVTSGPTAGDPVGVLTSDRCREMFASLLVGGTLVLVDTPPMLSGPDVTKLAEVAPLDAIMLVASEPLDGNEHVRHAVDAAHRIGVPQVGVVLATGASPNASETAPRWPRRRQNGFGDNGDPSTWATALDPAHSSDPIASAPTG
jgi:Mrp family chromosome partitioning ATPase